jgi:hypothetical protein
MTLLIGLLSISTSFAASQMETVQILGVFEEEKRPAWRAFSDLRYGPIELESEVITAVFTASNHQVLFAETGGALYDILGVSVGAGLIREKGFLLGVDGTTSTQEDMLSVIPLQANGLLRLDFFNEQVLVPFATAGVDYWIWQEKWTNGDLEEQIFGGKMGYHYSVGGQILLDRFDESSASLLEVTRGVQDTYLSVEYRVQEFDTEGLSFDSNSITVGIRFQY